jgi:transposase InsO family protein/transposase-like protein
MAVRARLAGASEFAVMKAFEIRTPGALLVWVRAYESRGPAGLGGTAAEEAQAASAPNLPEVVERVEQKYRDDIRRRFAGAIEARRGYEAASKIAGIPFSTGWAWQQKHKTGGLLALLTVAPPNSYPASVKLAAARAVVDDGATRADVMRRHGLRAHTTLNKWVVAYRREGKAAFASRAPAPRKSPRTDAVRRISQENEALSDVIARLDATMSTAMKMSIVASLAEKYPVRPLLRALNLPASTYYYRRSRPLKLDNYEAVRPVLREAFSNAYNAYGYRRPRTQLRAQHGFQISGKTVRRLMKEEGCRCIARRRKQRSRPEIPSPAHIYAPNLLKRDFSATEPGQKWVTDVTQFSVAGQTLFLSPLIDLFNGEILSYRVGTNQNMPVVLDMLKDALPLRRPGITTLHSDRGWQYQHASFRTALRRNGIKQSMSRRGNCYDNACAENFFSHFKQEFLRGRRWHSTAQFLDDLARYLHWFNHDRIKARLDNLSPVHYREKTQPTPADCL